MEINLSSVNNAPRPYRPLQLGHVIQEELAKYFVRDVPIEDAMLTILDVTVSKDSLHAQVKVGIIPLEKAPEVWKELNRRKGEFEHMLLKKSGSRSVPHLSFAIDEGKIEADES